MKLPDDQWYLSHRRMMYAGGVGLTTYAVLKGSVLARENISRTNPVPQVADQIATVKDMLPDLPSFPSIGGDLNLPSVPALPVPSPKLPSKLPLTKKQRTLWGKLKKSLGW